MKDEIIKEAVTIFDISEEELNTMTKSELTRQFRKRARELHPDQGGDHNQFIKLVNSYKDLLKLKK